MGQRTESRLAFIFFFPHRNITFIVLALQRGATQVQYDEHSGRGDVFQGAKYVGDTLLFLTKEFVRF